MKKNQLGEVATIITISTLFILGIVSLVSTSVLNKPKTTSTKAQEKTNCAFKDYDECNVTYKCDDCQMCDDYSYECLGTSEQGQTSDTTDTTTDGTSDTSASTTEKFCECNKGQIINRDLCGDTNPCGPESGGGCNYGQWKNECTGSATSCPADAGVTYTYWCDKNGKWRFQYPNCVVWCKPSYLSKPPSKPNSECENKTAGDIIEEAYDVSCDGQLGPEGEWVIMNKFCDQFGQVQSGPSGSTHIACTSDVNDFDYAGKTLNKKAIASPNQSTANKSGCFHLDVEGNQTKTTDGVKFAFKALFVSDGGDGDIKLDLNGKHVAGWNAWNLKVHGKTFTYEPQYTGGDLLVKKGQSLNLTYTGTVANSAKCPGVQSSKSCQLFVDAQSGDYSSTCKITNGTNNNTRPIVQWAAPPTLKVTQKPLVFQGKTSGNTTTDCTITDSKDCTNEGKKYVKCFNGKYRCTDANIVETPTPTLTVTPDPTSGVGVSVDSTNAKYNRCPDKNGATCTAFQCGSGYQKIDMPCISFWDVCCVNTNSGPKELLTPIMKQIDEKEFEYQLSASPVAQAIEIRGIANTYLCDYYGSSNFGTKDIRNCQKPVPGSFSQNGDKVTLKFKTNSVQKQMICTIVANVPYQCFPAN